jgi:hypothetical protein
MKQSTLIETRKPNKAERISQPSAEVVFIREDSTGREHIIYGCTCYESWEQWGASIGILVENVNEIENWRQSQ